LTALGSNYTFSGDQAESYNCVSTACSNDFNTSGMSCSNLSCETPLSERESLIRVAKRNSAGRELGVLSSRL